MAVDRELVKLLVCPACHGRVEYKQRRKVIVCSACELRYPVRDDIPVMLIDEATRLRKPGQPPEPVVEPGTPPEEAARTAALQREQDAAAGGAPTGGGADEDAEGPAPEAPSDDDEGSA